MDVQEDYILAFQRWCAMDGKAASGPKYVGYLSCFNRDYAEPTHSTWDGLYAFAYGHKATREVVEIGSFREFEMSYGAFRLAVLSLGCPDGMSSENYQKILGWYNSPAVKGPSCLNAALNAYRDFVIWKTFQDPILVEFSSWLASSERKKGKGVGERTQECYLKSVVFLDCVIRKWGIDLECDLWAVATPQQFDVVEAKIRACAEFSGYNSNVAPDGFPKNLNGTGSRDPSAALTQLGEFIKSRFNGMSQPPDDSHIDRLSIAIEEFKAHRLDADWTQATVGNARKWTYYSVNRGTRDYFSKLDEQKVRAFGLPELTELFTGVKGQNGGPVFEAMWSGKNGQGWPHILKAFNENSHKVIGFLGDIAEAPTIISSFATPDFERPGGFGGSVISELLMKFHPTVGFKYGSKTAEALELIGLQDFEPHPLGFKQSEYDHVLSLAKMIRGKLEDAGLTRCIEDSEPPDLLTVNEFLGWVTEHPQLLEEAFKKAKVNDLLPFNADRLTAALKVFKASRDEEFQPSFDEPASWQGDAKIQYDNFVSQNANAPRSVSWYLDEALLKQECPEMTPPRALTIMMKVRPAEFATYSRMIDKMLVFTGVAKEPSPEKITVENYEANKALQGQVLAKMHELGIGKTADDDSPADYFTVNEFAWWLNDAQNQNLVKEKVLAMELKPINSKDSLKKGSRKLSDAFKDDELLKRLAAALRTKPFAILAGHSGTGKSQLVRRLAYMTCNNEKLIAEGKGKTAPGNYCMVQVKPNWHDSTDLIGYYSDLGDRHYVNTPFVQFLCKAYAYPDTPFFLCLDEMNLAPVEQYFAEYLSAVESLEEKGGVWISDSLVEVVKTGETNADGSFKVDEDILGQIMLGAQSTEAADWIRKHGLSIPKNLFVVGTVNMDETTCQFSRKVLDRAMTLLMNKVSFASMGKSVEPCKEELLNEDGIAFFMKGERAGKVGGTEAGMLDNLNKPLENTPFVVAYRFANEYALYEAALAKLDNATNVSDCAAEALDHVVLMKLLPRIHGERATVKEIFEGRDGKGGLSAVIKDGLSTTQMKSILERKDEYLTFWP